MTTAFTIFLLIVGLFFFVMGLRILFEKGYVEKRYSNEASHGFSAKEAYTYNKYGNGLRLLVLGLMALGLVLYGLFW